MYPDISAVGSRLLVVSGGGVGVSAGTSASTPIIASIVALVNDARMKLGKPPVGFFNPLFYQMVAQCPTCFRDVVSGSNRCTNSRCCHWGYYTAHGVDAVTGAGTPVVSEWIKYLTAQ